jgi:hypothetical protein
MEIDRAYCEELEQVLTIQEAQRLYWLQPEPRRRYRFGCEFQPCRDGPDPTITGVLYHRPIEDLDNASRMRFQRGPNSTHLDTCPLAEQADGEALVRDGQVRLRADANRGLPFEAIAADEVPDVLLIDPVAQGVELTIRDEQRDRIRHLASRYERVQAYAQLEAEQLQATGELADVVAAYRFMSSDERRQAQLTIPGLGRHSYAWHFRHIEQARDLQPRIHFGGARLARATGGFRITYFDSVTIDDLTQRPTLYLKDSELLAHPRGGFVRAQCQALLLGQFDYATAFFLGKMVRDLRSGRFIEAQPKSLDALVLVMRSKQDNG